MIETQLATFASGCFWCTEAVFKELKGVEKVVSGYCGGSVANPTYHQVSSDTSGHAEAVQVTFDPQKITYEQLLEVFFLTHDPTTKNRQGNDEGTQYRSVIFFHNEEQKKLAEKVKDKISSSGVYHSPIVTEIMPYSAFYPAEEYHQDYYQKNTYAPYCQFIIDPKLAKMRQTFTSLLKKPVK